MVILRFGEIFLTMELAVNGATNVVTRITDTLNLGYFAEHGAYFSFRFIAQVRIAHLIKITRYFNFHVI